VKATRFLDAAELDRALAATQQLVEAHDRAGEPIAISADTAIVVVVDFPEDLLVTLSKDKFAVEEDARHEVERLGVPVGPAQEAKDGWVYPIAVEPARRDAFLQFLDERGIHFGLRRERLTTTFGALTSAMMAPPGLYKTAVFYNFVAAHRIPEVRAHRFQVDSIQVASPIRIPPEAWIVVENELPGDFTWTLFLGGVLVVFLAFNLWILTRSIRGCKNAPAP
jgi:hypothetical protein